MESKKSLHNSSAFSAFWKMNMKRSWWMWLAILIYTLIGYTLPLLTYNSEDYYDYQTFLYSVQESVGGSYTSSFGIIMISFIVLFSALQQFSYLMNANASGFMHSMPAKKETIFAATYFSGLFPFFGIFGISLILNLLIGLAKGYGIASICLVGFVIVCLQIFIMYSFAVFCIMLTGIAVAAPFIYYILNFLAIGFMALLNLFMGLFLYGFPDSVGLEQAMYFSPMAKMISDLKYTHNADDVMAVNGWQMLLVYALVAVVFVLLAMACYKYRKNESAGSLLTIPLTQPIFKYGFSGCMSLLGTCFLVYLFFDRLKFPSGIEMIIVLAMVLIMGVFFYLIAEMLSQKDLRVFDGKVVIKSLPVLVVLFLLTIGLSLDPIGYENALPDEGTIESVKYQTMSSASASGELKDADQITMLRNLHAAVLEDKENQIAEQKSAANQTDDTSTTLTVDYKLTTGKTLRRSYVINMDEKDIRQKSGLATQWNTLLSDASIAEDVLFAGADSSYLSDVYVSLWSDDLITINPKDYDAVTEAIIEDMKEGMLYLRFFEAALNQQDNTAETFYYDSMNLNLKAKEKSVLSETEAYYYNGFYEAFRSYNFSTPSMNHLIEKLVELEYIPSDKVFTEWEYDEYDGSAIDGADLY